MATKTMTEAEFLDVLDNMFKKILGRVSPNKLLEKQNEILVKKGYDDATELKLEYCYYNMNDSLIWVYKNMNTGKYILVINYRKSKFASIKFCDNLDELFIILMHNEQLSMYFLDEILRKSVTADSNQEYQNKIDMLRVKQHENIETMILYKFLSETIDDWSVFLDTVDRVIDIELHHQKGRTEYKIELALEKEQEEANMILDLKKRKDAKIILDQKKKWVKKWIKKWSKKIKSKPNTK